MESELQILRRSRSVRMRRKAAERQRLVAVIDIVSWWSKVELNSTCEGDAVLAKRFALLWTFLWLFSVLEAKNSIIITTMPGWVLSCMVQSHMWEFSLVFERNSFSARWPPTRRPSCRPQTFFTVYIRYHIFGFWTWLYALVVTYCTCKADELVDVYGPVFKAVAIVILWHQTNKYITYSRLQLSVWLSSTNLLN